MAIIYGLSCAAKSLHAAAQGVFLASRPELLELLSGADSCLILVWFSSNQLTQKLDLTCPALWNAPVVRLRAATSAGSSAPVNSSLNVAVFGVSATGVPSDSGERF